MMPVKIFLMHIFSVLNNSNMYLRIPIGEREVGQHDKKKKLNEVKKKKSHVV